MMAIKGHVIIFNTHFIPTKIRNSTTGCVKLLCIVLSMIAFLSIFII